MTVICSNNTIKTTDPDFCYPGWITDFWDEMDQYPEEFGPEIWAARKLVDDAFASEELIIDIGLANNYTRLEKYMPYVLMPFQRCALYLWLCVYTADDIMPRWPDLYIIAGRGMGKDGTIAFAVLCLVSPFNPVKDYDVDICAANEEQALRPIKDLKKVLENPEFKATLDKYFYHTSVLVRGKANGGTGRGRTNNPSGRDGMRSGCIIFNEKHTYTDYKNLEVFETGLGKVEHPRSLTTTTDGNVIGGPLDDDKKNIQKILDGKEPDNGLLPFIFRINSDAEILDEHAWRRANPMLKRSPSLLKEYRKEFRKWKDNPDKHTSFPTKRLNLRKTNQETHVTSWDNIAATDRPLPDLTGKACVAGVDYSKSSDWLAINLHFRDGETRYDINHAWVCKNGADFPKLNCPVEQWSAAGLLTIVDEPDIRPQIVAEYLLEASRKYVLCGVAIDSYRWGLLSDCLLKYGWSFKSGNLTLLRNPSSEIKIFPIIESLFSRRLFVWGDNPMLRWATNNTKAVPATKSSLAEDAYTGNFRFGKIEPVRRKTDPFMALVASIAIEDKLPVIMSAGPRRRVGVVTY